MSRIQVVILGAAGRDFHVFNTVYRQNPLYEVVAFTAQQIPHIDGRRYPPDLAGELYPEGIPITAEKDLEGLIRERDIDLCVMAYSDVSHEYVMHLGSRVIVAGADFQLGGTGGSMIRSILPVVAVCASRTGAGKSQTSRAVARILREAGLRVGIVRHPMPYGDLSAQRIQRFASAEDLDRYEVTIEEREEYEPHMAAGSVVYAGVDYESVLRAVEEDADVVLWDGGNNDFCFFKADVYITVVDPHRPGHELAYYPGEANVRLADAVLINKVDTASPEAVQAVRDNVRSVNPRAMLLHAGSPITVDDPATLSGRRVLVVEDGPTVTHGGMRFGAGTLGARSVGAAEIVDPRPFLVGEMRDTFATYPELGPLLPAMGYSKDQIRDLEATIGKAVEGGVEAVAVGTPIDLTRLIRIPAPHTRVRYELRVQGKPDLYDALLPILSKRLR